MPLKNLLTALLVLLLAGCGEPKRLRAIEDVPVFASVAEARRDAMAPKRRIPKGTLLTLTGCIHEKDYLFLGVELHDGSSGVIYPGDEFEYIAEDEDQFPC